MPEIRYISTKIFDWDFTISSWTGDSMGHSDDDRAYAFLERAEELLAEGENEFNRIDAIANLKRAINHRLKHLESKYRLNSIKFNGKPKGKQYLELLERYGIARHLIVKNLIKIRNDIEHEDVSPPDMLKCSELVDTVWYFLKSSDVVSRIADIETEFTLPGWETYFDKYQTLHEKYRYCIRQSPKEVSWGITWLFPKSLVFQTEMNGSVRVECSSIRNWAELTEIAERNKEVIKYNENDVAINAKSELSGDIKYMLWKKTFTEL